MATRMRERLQPLIQRLAASDTTCGRLPSSAQIYCVGGAVRDALLGLPDSDRDYVVVGVTVQQMLDAGFKPVGKDFPVFLHPETHEEFALARTERKLAKGYKGFMFQADPTVRLEDDLHRRDLTINAIAVGASGEIIDPHHGLHDLGEKILRHVGPAFSEDPVRLLRLARFAARWPDFTIAPQTLALCKEIVAHGEAEALVAERVWQEIAKGLAEPAPSKMIDLLHETGAWDRLGPQIPRISETTCRLLNEAAIAQAALEVRYALLIRNPDSAGPIPEGLFKAPKACQELAALLIAQSASVDAVLDGLNAGADAAASQLLDWLLSADVIRRADRFRLLIQGLQIAKDITPDQAALFTSTAAHISSASANHEVAQAIRQADASQPDLAEVARKARLSVLKNHPVFLRSQR